MTLPDGFPLVQTGDKGGRSAGGNVTRLRPMCPDIGSHNLTMRFHLRQRQPRDTRPRLPTVDVAWIAENRRPFDAHEVGSIIPVVFARYARLFHPAWAALDRRDSPVRWDAVAAWSGRTMHPVAQWGSLSEPATAVDQPPPFVAPQIRSAEEVSGRTYACSLRAGQCLVRT